MTRTMRTFIYTILPFFLLLYSCEEFQQEEEVVCLPVNMTATVIQGTESTKVIADFHYVPGTSLLDHITWSNHQTHYFEYNEDESMRVVRQMKVKEKIQVENWFQYDGALVDRVLLVKRNLDYVYLEPTDSIYTGYIDFIYNGEDVIEENRYEWTPNGKELELVWKVEYDYDSNGNIIGRSASDPRSKSAESYAMTYDSSKHPFAHVKYYFSGESYVNNQLSLVVGHEDLDYRYELKLNGYGYPEIIYEKLGTTNTRIIRYSYLCE